MSATGQRRRIGRIVVVTVVFTVGIQLGDAAFHAVQKVGDLPALQETDFNEHDQDPCLTLGGLSLDGLADRLLKLFRLDRTHELASDAPPDYLARN